jgi:NTE family protein
MASSDLSTPVLARASRATRCKSACVGLALAGGPLDPIWEIDALCALEETLVGVDFALFEPDHRDPEMFAANPFSYSARHPLAEHDHQSTRNNLRMRRRALHAMFGPHGIAIADKVPDDPSRRLVNCRSRMTPAWHGTLRHLGGVPDALQSSLAAA